MTRAAEYPGTEKDRKGAAAYYTSPEAASMLAMLALDGAGVRDDPLIPIRVIDLCCGTGQLLLAGLNCIGELGLPNPVVLIGRDIMPEAVEAARHTLTGVADSMPNEVRIDLLVMPFGVCKDGTTTNGVKVDAPNGAAYTGSLELMDPEMLRRYGWDDGEPKPVTLGGRTETSS